MLPMSRALPQGTVQDERGFDLLVACFAVLFTPEVFEDVTHRHALRMIKRETRPFILHAKKI